MGDTADMMRNPDLKSKVLHIENLKNLIRPGAQTPSLLRQMQAQMGPIEFVWGPHRVSNPAQTNEEPHHRPRLLAAFHKTDLAYKDQDLIYKQALEAFAMPPRCFKAYTKSYADVFSDPFLNQFVTGPGASLASNIKGEKRARQSFEHGASEFKSRFKSAGMVYPPLLDDSQPASFGLDPGQHIFMPDVRSARERIQVSCATLIDKVLHKGDQDDIHVVTATDSQGWGGFKCNQVPALMTRQELVRIQQSPPPGGFAS